MLVLFFHLKQQKVMGIMHKCLLKIEMTLNL
jgi:hypothetical protein